MGRVGAGKREHFLFYIAFKIMPELPEVQTTVNGLNKAVLNKKIKSVWFDWNKFKDVEKVRGYKINKVLRRGKNILFYLDKNRVLLVHMKMTGHLLVGRWEIRNKKVVAVSPAEVKERVNDFIHFIIELENGRMIGFSDMRKFGKVVFGEKGEIENLSYLKKLGPDALKISLLDFSRRVGVKKKTIYQALMDQTAISGIGNIYANDVMWKAKVYPFRPANKLSNKELKALYQAIKVILSKALKMKGTSTADYRDVAGKKGGYGPHRLIYQREGELCSRCKTKIKRIKKGGRSAHFCPRCQKI